MRSLGFLTRLPVPASWFDGHDGQLTQTARAFPLAGAIAALPAVFVLTAGTLIDLPVLLTAALATAALIITCGGLHEDGLADVADGLFGGQDKTRRLEIMKDSRIGAYGAMALILAIAARVIALAAILQAGLIAAAFALVAGQALSRSAMIWHWSSLPNARTDGVAASAGQPGKDERAFALATGLAIAVVLGLMTRGPLVMLLAIILSVTASLLFQRICDNKIGGHTGDTLGASAIVAETAFMTGLASGL